ncbi:ABC-2 type transporter-domain-containing protein [Lasiosphaeria miniovina]|uniref:ABC-2 type transporter-domain-containing protein n=1 Tax=Lasiosphaeria miniovina TaxID=1954250 RepID=A0AA40A4J8_9PEZI|nr:ABC-2 type transporter-domain-containing protein [Lasiosphaeria miniovina]KAK0709208.1 ABC-2 type transporter-domain-containing protein [Lasiosphaeria miniovina]
MSLTGTNSFGSYDRTAQNSGLPAIARQTTHEETEDATASSHVAGGSSPSRHDDVTRTRATSVTEVADSDAGHNEKGALDKMSREDEDDDAIEEDRRHTLVQALARQYTSQSHAGETKPGTNVFVDSLKDESSPLNPNGPNFSAKAWARAVVAMVSGQGHQFRTTGVAFQHLNVFGFGTPTDYQKDFLNIWLEGIGMVRRLLGNQKRRIDILRDFDGLVRKGEMLVVLGPPGSGCSTLLKTIAGDFNGIFVDDDSYFNYQGMTAKEMHTNHRGEAIYTAEVDTHFPQLSVGDTLTFAARARAPRYLPEGVTSAMFSNHLRDVVMAMYGISHTVDTRVGNEYIRGVSGGERKRVTISEATLSGAPLQCWDNSTRGLDSANALEFCKTLRLSTELFESTACVSIYQSSQSAYDLFDKAIVLYEGRQIFFGRADQARQYFIDLGFDCPARATTPDFLTSMTSPIERIVRPGFEGKAPRTPDEFAAAWKNSAHYKALQAEIEEYKVGHPINGPDAVAFRDSRKAQQAKGQRAKSPFTLSYIQQIELCLWRGWRRLVGDPSLTLGALIGNFIMALIISSVFFNLQPTTASFFQRGALLFFACLMNAFASALEILILYAQRPIVEKHDRYALYHPSAEAVASMLVDMPYKILNCLTFNLTLYFMTGLRREPGAFFFFLLISFVTVLTMSMMFRTIASTSRTLSQAMVPAAIIILDLIIFTGFAIPIDYMLGWCRWLNYLDPLAYAFEALMVNEFHNRDFTCTQYVPSPLVPGYEDVGDLNRVCSAIGSVAGSGVVNGDAYLNTGFSYLNDHKWRDFGLILVFMAGFLAMYILAAENVSAKKSRGEVLVFRRGHKPASFKENKGDAESGGTPVVGPIINEDINGGNASDGVLQRQTSVFHWSNVCYEVKIKGEPRQILDRVDGWVKPGTLTALMGVSGAGKTTLLDCLADRTSMGVITGEMLVDGSPRDTSFQRKTGYVQQQDLHLQTTTVREALNFSALLRQPAHVPRQEKLDYVEEVIKLLEMEEYADAIIGVPGEGLNVEQRKRLTIGVELAAKPPLLLFVDEPTSGLDSQTSWAILDLLEKLTKSGQAILCTIHQPSAMLFQRFDRLLFLAKGGKTVYYGDIGENSKTMTSYFERHSGLTCPAEANPAEWMLEVIGAAPGSTTDLDWYNTWRESAEYEATQQELQRLKADAKEATVLSDDKGSYREFAAPFLSQLREVTYRVFQQYWRTPSYIYSKMALCVLVALFIGFVFFNAPNTIQGLQNQMFAIFNLLTVFGQLVQQTMPHFVIQRALYEVRERPSKVYGWKVFMLSQIIVELPWNILMAALMFFSWYYPVGLHHNAAAADQVVERGGLMFLLLVAFLLFTSTFTDFIIAGFETAEAGGNIANLLFTLCLIFCGVLANPDTLPRFWIFMYRLSPFTYLVSAMLSTGVANTEVRCAANEYLKFEPLNGTCGEYFDKYITATGGYLLDPSNLKECAYCAINNTNQFLLSVNADYADRWRNFGIMFAFIIFNVFAALAVYWIVRVPKNKLGGKKKKE